MTLLLLLVLGGAGLYFGAEWLVDGAAKLARRLGLPPVIIGLTIVSYGTSAPELVVSLMATFAESSPMAVGNVVGSNIANVGLILGLTALIAPPAVDGSLRRRELPLLLLASLALPLVLLDGQISRVEGTVFALGAFVYTWVAFRSPRPPPSTDGDDDGGTGEGVARLVALIVLGLVVLLIGGKAFVVGAVGIARSFGMSERVVGLTVVAIGTSLPELAASLVAALRGHSELAVGNVVGSNLFNLLLVLGLAATIHPIAGSLTDFASDIGVMIAITLVGMISMRKERRMKRLEGGILLLAYAGFIAKLATGT
jgi:cation:H+ antiporter